MTTQTDEIAARLAGATAGPWRENWTDDAPSSEVAVWSVAPGLAAEDCEIVCATWYDGPVVELTRPNAAFIAAAPADIAFLLSENARLRAANESLAEMAEAALDNLSTTCLEWGVDPEKDETYTRWRKALENQP